MDKLAAMRLFTRIVERRSFSAAATDLGLPRSTVTETVKQMEARLGARLLQRTTRHVAPTLDGEAYYRRCLSILTDIEDAEGALSGAQPRGVLRLDVHGTLARHFVVPKLPAFLDQYPGLHLHVGEGDRLVDSCRKALTALSGSESRRTAAWSCAASACWTRPPVRTRPTLSTTAPLPRPMA